MGRKGGGTCACAALVPPPYVSLMARSLLSHIGFDRIAVAPDCFKVPDFVHHKDASVSFQKSSSLNHSALVSAANRSDVLSIQVFHHL